MSNMQKMNFIKKGYESAEQASYLTKNLILNTP